jgi:protein phosphatase
VNDERREDLTGEAAPVGNGSLRDNGATAVLEWGLCSESGPVRGHNEDCAGALVAPEGAEDFVHPVFVVADGLGGHAAGEVASRLAVDTVTQRWSARAGDDPAKLLRSCAREANSAIVSASYDRGRSGMGSTLTALAVAGREALIAHVGDSRAYLVRQDSCLQLTTDHSRVGEMLRMKLITPERAATHPARSQLTRSLGGALSLQVDLVRQDVEVGDTFVLCSDGLWGDVARSEIQVMVDAIGSAAVPDAASAALGLVGLAIERGAADNVTAVVVRVLSDQAVANSSGRRPLFRRRR